MNKSLILLTAIFASILLNSCTRSTENTKSTLNTIKVTSAEEFINAIGSNRNIEIAAGDYLLSEIPDRHMEHIRWDPAFDGKTITIRNLENVTIRGQGQNKTNLLVTPRYVFVLNFENCTNIELQDLTLGHTPDKGSCTSGVIGAKNCRNLFIDNCDLFGCGTEGLTLENVNTFGFTNSIIRECSYGIMTITGCKDLNFQNAKLINNQEYWGININDSKNILFEQCTVTGNQIDAPLFNIISSSDVKLRNS